MSAVGDLGAAALRLLDPETAHRLAIKGLALRSCVQIWPVWTCPAPLASPPVWTRTARP